MNVTAIQLCTYTPNPGSELLPGTTTVHVSFATREIDPGQSYIIKAATGLDAEEIISSFVGLTFGTRTYNMKPAKRTVTMLLNLNPSYNAGETPSSLRDALYRIISINRRSKLQLRLMDGETEVGSLFGDITKFEASAFNSDSEVQITFVADYAFIRPTTYVQALLPAIPYTWTDDLTTAPHGFLMQWVINDYTSSFIVRSSPNYEFTVNSYLEPDDIVYIGSEDDNKYVYFERRRSGGPGYDRFYLADKVTQGSTWPIMLPGSNTVQVSGVADLIAVSWRPSYWGI